MPNLLETGMAFLDAQRKAHMAKTVRYYRGVHYVDLAATAGRTAFEEQDADGGLAIAIKSNDWIVSQADLVLNGVAAKPMNGDVIVEDLGTLNPKNFEVTSQLGTPCYEEDPHHTIYRVHTKRSSAD